MSFCLHYQLPTALCTKRNKYGLGDPIMNWVALTRASSILIQVIFASNNGPWPLTIGYRQKDTMALAVVHTARHRCDWCLMFIGQRGIKRSHTGPSSIVRGMISLVGQMQQGTTGDIIIIVS